MDTEAPSKGIINQVIYFSVYQRGIVLLVTALLMLGGAVSFFSLPIDAVPDITNNQVQVFAKINGLAPEEIERTITFPLETAMRGIKGVEQIRSITRFGLSQITVIFKESMDLYKARQLVSERLITVTASLPPSTEIQLGPISTGLGEIYQYVLDTEVIAQGQARVEQLMKLRSIQDWYLTPRLLSVEGVTEINSVGGFEKQFHVEPDLKKMALYRISFREIVEALKRVNRNVGGGYIEESAEQFLVQGVGLLKDIQAIEKVHVKTLDNFHVLRIEDLAKVRLGKELRVGAATYDGHEVVLGTVMMLQGENSRTVSARVGQKIEELKKNLPNGIKLETTYDRSVLVNATLATVEKNLVYGAFLVTVVLMLLLGNLRAALVTALTIPLTLLFTFLVMKPLGLSGNLMSLGALDFGIIVDGTVIVLDNCVRTIQNQTRLLGRKLTRAEIQEAIYRAAVEIRMAAGFGELIIVIVFLPVFALSGVEGKMFIPMASTFAIAVFGALVLSFTAAPAVASLVLSGRTQSKDPWLMKHAQKIYLKILLFAISRKNYLLAVGALSVVTGVFLLSRLGAEFLPQLSEGSFAFGFVRPVNISLTQSLEMQKMTDSLIEEFPEVQHVFSRIGTSKVATDPMGVNGADTYIMLWPRSQWPKIDGRRRTESELAQQIKDKLEKFIPGQTIMASQPIQARFNELLEGTRADVSIKVFGHDLKSNMDTAVKIQKMVQNIPGAGDVGVDLLGLSPILKINPKDQELAKFGASLDDLLQSISVSMAGEEAGYIYEQEKKFPIVVRLGLQDRESLASLEKIPIKIPGNAWTELKNLADLKFHETIGMVSRENSMRRSAVLINLRGRDTESFVMEAQKKVREQILLPPDTEIEWGGNFKNLEQAKSRLSVLAPIALLLVLLMIYAAFGSLPQTFLVFSCVPLALVGGVLNLIVMGLPFSISAAIGFITLSGIAVLNGVVLLNYFNQLKSQGLSGVELVKKATAVRLRPVLMTALVAIFGFIPMMLSTGVGSEVQKPLATVVIGGIVSSTILTLILLPILYLVFEKHMQKFSLKMAH